MRRFAVAGLLGAGLILGAPSMAAGQSLSCQAGVPPGVEGGVEAGEPERGSVACFGGPAGAGYSFSTTSPSHGAVSNTRAGSHEGEFLYTYTAAAAYRGPDSFRVNASRGGESASVDVAFTVVAPVNEAPSCNGPFFDGYHQRFRPRFPAGKAVAGGFPCRDEEHAPISYSIVQPPVFGSVSGVRTERDPKSVYFVDRLEGVFTLKPEAGYSGPDDFTLRAFDGVKCSNVKLSYLVLPARKSPNPVFAETTGCGALVRPPLLSGRSASAAVRVSRKGSFTLPRHLMICSGAGPACPVKVSVTAAAPANAARRLRIGRSSFNLAAASKRKIKGKLSRTGRRLLKQAGARRARVKITVRRGKAKPAKKTIKVKLNAPR